MDISSKFRKGLGITALLTPFLFGCGPSGGVSTEFQPDYFPSQETRLIADAHYEILGVKGGMFILRMSFTKDCYDRTETKTISPDDMSMGDFKILMRVFYKND